MGVTKGYWDLAWGQVHYRTVTADARLPAMLLLHQSPLSARMLEPLLPHLAARVRPYALDTPGYGSSSPAPEGWTVEDYAALVWDCAERIGASEAFLFGRATGAVFALAAALGAPPRVRGLALHGLPVYTPEERTERLARFAPPIEPEADGSHLAAIWSRVKGEYPWMDAALATRCVQAYLEAGPDFASSYRAIWRYDLAARAPGRLAVPTLLLAGTRDRIGFMFERAKALLPGAEAVLMEGATDFVAEQDPALLAGHLLRFVERLSARGGRRRRARR
jgi:pimeloyl-ACP methyl ester carboxylesterase